jgi:hypothetical protein
MHLVEKTEAHVVVGLFLLCEAVSASYTISARQEHLPSSLASSFVSSAAAPPAAAPPAAAPPPPPPPDGTDASLELPSEINCAKQHVSYVVLKAPIAL